MATLCASTMRAYGLEARLVPVPGGPPVVYGERQGRSAKTLLFYDHYDVQPPEPLDLWESPPFELTARNGRLFARGVADNKGNLMSRMAAVRAWLDATGELPVSVKFVVEGEEEVGSPHLAPFVESHRNLLAADACIWESGGVNWQGQPVITLGLKGIMYVELEARGANRDMHSAQATSVVNPAWRLVWALATLKDQNENIRIDGHYDDVRPPTADELTAVSLIPSDEEQTQDEPGHQGVPAGIVGPGPAEAQPLRAHLHHLRAVERLLGRWLQDGAAVGRPRQDRLPSGARHGPGGHPRQAPPAPGRPWLFGDISFAASTPASAPGAPPSPTRSSVVVAAAEVYGLEPVISPTMTGSGPMYPFGAHWASPLPPRAPATRTAAPTPPTRTSRWRTSCWPPSTSPRSWVAWHADPTAPDGGAFASDQRRKPPVVNPAASSFHGVKRLCQELRTDPGSALTRPSRSVQIWTLKPVQRRPALRADDLVAEDHLAAPHAPPRVRTVTTSPYLHGDR